MTSHPDLLNPIKYFCPLSPNWLETFSWLGTITNVCFVCLVEGFGLGCYFVFFPIPHRSWQWLDYYLPVLPWWESWVHVSIKQDKFILKENKKNMMVVGDFSHRTGGTAWVVLWTTFCFYFWLVILSSSRQHHCARYQKAPRPQLSCAPAVLSDLEKFRYISLASFFSPGR